MLRRLGIILGISIALFFLMTPTAFAQSNDNTPDLIKIKQSIITLQELEQHGVLTQAEAEKSIAYYIAQASKAVGHPLTLHQILATPDPISQKLTPLQEFAGAIDFLRVMLVLAIIAVVGAVTYLFRYYVAKLLRIIISIPIVAYEIVFYAASLGFGICGWLLPEPFYTSLGLLAALLFAGALGFSANHRRRLAHVFPFSLCLLLVWAPAAFLFKNSFIGFIAIGALLAVLGTNFLVTETFESVRFDYVEGDGWLERTTFAAFLVLALFVALRVIGALNTTLAIFEFGALFLGSVVGYGGLLIVSSSRHQKKGYWLSQIAAMIAGIGALFIGSVFQISELEKIGGTFFVLYCLAKIGDIPTRSQPAFALLITFVGITTICFCWFALTHQVLFQQWLFLPA